MATPRLISKLFLFPTSEDDFFLFTLLLVIRICHENVIIINHKKKKSKQAKILTKNVGASFLNFLNNLSTGSNSRKHAARITEMIMFHLLFTMERVRSSNVK